VGAASLVKADAVHLVDLSGPAALAAPLRGPPGWWLHFSSCILSPASLNFPLSALIADEC
jgi:hypothetical protein